MIAPGYHGLPLLEPGAVHSLCSEVLDRKPELAFHHAGLGPNGVFEL